MLDLQFYSPSSRKIKAEIWRQGWKQKLETNAVGWPACTGLLRSFLIQFRSSCSGVELNIVFYTFQWQREIKKNVLQIQSNNSHSSVRVSSSHLTLGSVKLTKTIMQNNTIKLLGGKMAPLILLIIPFHKYLHALYFIFNFFYFFTIKNFLPIIFHTL